MRPRHTQHSLPAFPVYSAAFIAPNELVVGGGGGSSKSGIKNKLRLYKINAEREIEVEGELEVEDAPTSMAVDLESKNIICGINSPPDKIQKGENENCRVVGIKDGVLQLDKSKSTLPADEDDYQKVTVLSPDGKLLAVAGCHDLSILSFPGLTHVASSIRLEKEIYDATFSSTSETLVVATTHNLHVYSVKAPLTSSGTTKGKGKAKNTPKKAAEEKVGALELIRSVDLPSSIGGPGACTFRSARYHPSDDNVLYAVINTVPPRGRGRQTPARQGYISKWDTATWVMEKQRKVGDKGLTTFDISLDGRFLGYGSSDLSIGMLDSKTLSPLFTILKAHEFPPTIIKFDPSSKVLASGSADNTLRIATIPEVVGGSSWTMIILVLLALLVALGAILVQNGGL